jgi:hypothetical protein
MRSTRCGATCSIQSPRILAATRPNRRDVSKTSAATSQCGARPAMAEPGKIENRVPEAVR